MAGRLHLRTRWMKHLNCLFKSKGKVKNINVKGFDVEVEDNQVSRFLTRIEILLE